MKIVRCTTATRPRFCNFIDKSNDMIRLALVIGLAMALFFSSCDSGEEATKPTSDDTSTTDTVATVEPRPAAYATFRLTTNLSEVGKNDRELIPLLIEAAKIMDTLFMWQAYGDPADLAALGNTPEERAYVRINYGPWDRLAGNAPFLSGIGAKPKGANFYPPNMTKAAFDSTELAHKKSLYTFLRYDEAGMLTTQWYHDRFAAQLERAASLLRRASEKALDPGLKRYLSLRAEALVTDDFMDSDLAWMDMKNNTIDVVIGPIETYEDQLFGYKAAYEAYVLVKDQAWSDRLAKYAQFLPMLQDELPVDEAYKQEEPGSDADLNAYDVIYYAGDCNAGSKTIAINLPNDERVQLEKGTRRLQLKNAMQAKFDKILKPISAELIVADQRDNVTFDAFFANTMFHEVAHGLGIKNTITGKGTVREALKEHASAIEEGKADILGIYMVSKLHEMGELGEVDLMDYYVTFMAGIFRSVRFGGSSAHGIANLLRFNYFKARNAFTKEGDQYRVQPEAFADAIAALSKEILTLQGDGDYAAVGQFIDQYGAIGPDLQADLDKVNTAGIPVDIVFEQGISTLGLN